MHSTAGAGVVITASRAARLIRSRTYQAPSIRTRRRRVRQAARRRGDQHRARLRRARELLVKAGVDVLWSTPPRPQPGVLDRVAGEEEFPQVEVIGATLPPAAPGAARRRVDGSGGIGPARSAPPGSSPGWACRRSPPWPRGEGAGRRRRALVADGGIRYSATSPRHWPPRLERDARQHVRRHEEAPGEVSCTRRSYKSYRAWAARRHAAGLGRALLPGQRRQRRQVRSEGIEAWCRTRACWRSSSSSPRHPLGSLLRLPVDREMRTLASSSRSPRRRGIARARREDHQGRRRLR